MQVGSQVEIAGRSEDELHGELTRLLASEARYAKHANLECSRKWDSRHILMGGTQLSCYSCPHFTPYGLADTSHDGRGGVCRVGRAQEDLVVMLEALKQREAAASLDAELVAHFEGRIELASELAEAVLA